MNVLQSLGLTLDNLSDFGITGSNAAAFVGSDAVADFIAANFASGNVADTIAFANQADATRVAQGQPAVYGDYISQVNDILSQNGISADDISYSIDANGNVTGSLDGVSTTVININDLLAQAAAESGF